MIVDGSLAVRKAFKHMAGDSFCDNFRVAYWAHMPRA
jgi:hypothetical protein